MLQLMSSLFNIFELPMPTWRNEWLVGLTTQWVQDNLSFTKLLLFPSPTYRKGKEVYQNIIFYFLTKSDKYSKCKQILRVELEVSKIITLDEKRLKGYKVDI